MFLKAPLLASILPPRCGTPIAPTIRILQERGIQMPQPYDLQTSDTVWQRIFRKSKVNGAPYEEQPVDSKWHWPEKTYLQRRLGFLRTNRSAEEFCEPECELRTDITDSDISADSVSETGASLETDRISVNPDPIFIDIPSDDWIWCSNPTSNGRNDAAQN